MSPEKSLSYQLEEEALLFRTQVGDQWRAYDPLRVGRLFARELQGDSLLKLLRIVQGDKQADGSYLVLDEQLAFEAAERAYQAGRVAFSLPDIAADGTGFTEKTVHRVLCEFLQWQAAVKANFARSPISGPSAASAPSAGPSPRSNATPSGCTAGASISNAPKG